MPGRPGRHRGRHLRAAVAKAIGELADLVRYIVNNLNGNFVLVTADHGFLFTERRPDETDKSKLSDKPPGTVTAKKRYLLGHDLPGQRRGLARAAPSSRPRLEGDMEFWIPEGGQPVPLHRRRALRPRRGHAPGDRRAGRYGAST